MSDIELNNEQASAILVEGLARGLYENQGKIPDDPTIRLEDATKLVQAAEAASRNGNKSDNVNTILFIAQVDQKPITMLPPNEQKVAEAVANNDTIIVEKRESVSTNIHNGLDLTTLTDGVIEGLIIGLDKYPNSEQVEIDRKAFTAERERRKNAQAQKGQEVPQAEAPGEASQGSSQIADASVEASPVVADQAAGKAGTGDASSPQSRDSGAQQQTTKQGEDAGAFARAQTPETSAQGKQTKAKSAPEDGERVELESQLTLPMVKAHGVDVTKIGDLSELQLIYIIKNPNGPTKEDKMPIDEQEIESNTVPSERSEGKAVGTVSTKVVDQEQIISKADLGLDVDSEESATGEISAEREQLESMVTGPMLKAYARGRKEIPSIGDNELRFMILNSDGKVTPDELDKAKALDQDQGMEADQEREMVEEEGKISPEPEPHMEVTKEISGPEGKDQVVGNTDLLDIKKSRVLLEVDPQDEPQDNQGNAEQAVALESEFPEKNIKKVEVESETRAKQQNLAMEIIFREGMPIPPELNNEEAPVLPMDVSAISRDELFSLHAKFHACEIRMNYVLMEHEDLMNDCIKLREYREAEVAKSVPFLGEDGKRNTNEFRDAQVNGDKEVLELGMKEHEARKIVTDLKVFRNGFHLDCERLSRQMSKYERERADAPR